MNFQFLRCLGSVREWLDLEGGWAARELRWEPAQEPSRLSFRSEDPLFSQSLMDRDRGGERLRAEVNLPVPCIRSQPWVEVVGGQRDPAVPRGVP